LKVYCGVVAGRDVGSAAERMICATHYLPRKGDDDRMWELRWIYERRGFEEGRRGSSGYGGRSLKSPRELAGFLSLGSLVLVLVPNGTNFHQFGRILVQLSFYALSVSDLLLFPEHYGIAVGLTR